MSALLEEVHEQKDLQPGVHLTHSRPSKKAANHGSFPSIQQLNRR